MAYIVLFQNNLELHTPTFFSPSGPLLSSAYAHFSSAPGGWKVLLGPQLGD